MKNDNTLLVSLLGLFLLAIFNMIKMFYAYKMNSKKSKAFLFVYWKRVYPIINKDSVDSPKYLKGFNTCVIIMYLILGLCFLLLVIV